jgi:hypothetical protein
MITLRTLALSVSFSFLIMSFANADTKPVDPLQAYRDQITQAETNASQNVLNQLGPINPPNFNTTLPSPSAPSVPSVSNSAKAFSTPTPNTTQKNALPPNTNRQSVNNNPWLKPNPWAEQAKVNPWANAPIPGPGNTTASTNTASAPPGPPNIFAPPQPSNTQNK